MAINITQSLIPESMEDYMSLFGMNDEFVGLIEDAFNVSVKLRNNELTIDGEDPVNVSQACTSIEKTLKMIHRHETIDRMKLRYVIDMIRDGRDEELEEVLSNVVAVSHRGKQVRCKTYGQKQYVNAIREHELTFAIGPAGTGKTYLAMALAVVALKNKEVERIVLTRPAVEAGEKLGFLPGDLTQKVDPYLRPLYDALYDFMGLDSYQKLMERGILEVAPLAYMRGRTLSDSFIILDEAQNTTPEQMKMFLTRMGFNSKVVVTGDITQTDLPYGKRSGLAEAITILKDIPEVGIVELTHRDVVRHELVQKITQAYDLAASSDQQKKAVHREESYD